MRLNEVLANRDFRLLLSGQGLSWVGDAFNPIALSVAIVLSGGGASELGAILASAVVARLVCTLFGGVWADRLPPHRIMVAADIVRGASTAALAVAFAVGEPPLWLLAALAGVTSGAGAFFYPAFVSLRPLVVPQPLWQNANAAVNFLQSGSQLAGPVLAGFVVAHSGPVVGFAANAATFFWSAACVALVRARAQRRATRSSMLSEMGEGLAEIRRHRWLWTGLVSAGMFHLAGGAFIVLVEISAVTRLGGASALGLIAAAQGLGGLLGGLLALRFQPRRMLLWSFVGLAVFPIFPIAFAWPGGLVAVMGFALLAQAGLMFFDVGWGTALQEGVPHERLARVASWDILISFIALPIGNLAAGPLSERFSTSSVMVGIGGWLLVAGCWPLLVTSVRGFTRTPPPAADRGVEGEGEGEGKGEGLADDADGGQPRAATAAS